MDTDNFYSPLHTPIYSLHSMDVHNLDILKECASLDDEDSFSTIQHMYEEKGYSILARDSEAFCAAVAARRHETVLYMLEDPCVDVNARNGTPLRDAVTNNDLKMVEILLSADAATHLNGDALVSMACSWDNSEILELLFTHGAPCYFNVEYSYADSCKKIFEQIAATIQDELLDNAEGY